MDEFHKADWKKQDPTHRIWFYSYKVQNQVKLNYTLWERMHGWEAIKPKEMIIMKDKKLATFKCVGEEMGVMI